MTTWSVEGAVRIVACCVLGLVFLLDPGAVETETAAKCEAGDTTFQEIADHKTTMLSACRRELAQAYDLADEAAKLVDLADSNVDELFDRCAGNDKQHLRAELLNQKGALRW